MERKWLTLGQAANVTGRSKRTIERWVADQRLPAVEVAGARYVNELELLTVERERRNAPRGNTGPRLVLVDLTDRVVASPQVGPVRPEQGGDGG